MGREASKIVIYFVDMRITLDTHLIHVYACISEVIRLYLKYQIYRKSGERDGREASEFFYVSQIHAYANPYRHSISKILHQILTPDIPIYMYLDV